MKIEATKRLVAADDTKAVVDFLKEALTIFGATRTGIVMKGGYKTVAVFEYARVSKGSFQDLENELKGKWEFQKPELAKIPGHSNFLVATCWVNYRGQEYSFIIDTLAGVMVVTNGD